MKAAYFQKIWDVLPFPALIVTADEALLQANAAAETLMETSCKQMQRHRLSYYFGAHSSVSDMLAQLQTDRPSFTLNNAKITLQGKPAIACTISVTRLPSGESPDEPPGEPMVLLVLQPITIAQKMRRAMSSHSAVRSMSGLSAMMAHEIRNPLAGISGAGQLLSMNVQGQDRKLANLITQEANRIARMVDGVDFFGDQRPLNFQPVNIHTVLDQVRTLAQSSYALGVDFRVDYDPSLPEVAGDHDGLIQVFQNLIKNAAEALGAKKGVISIRTSYNAGVKMAAPGGRTKNLPLQIEITDTGSGIPDDLIAEIFDPFVSSKTNGRGLGLSLVSKIIVDHGGLIECIGRQTGTCFLVNLPVWPKSKSKSKSKRIG